MNILTFTALLLFALFSTIFAMPQATNDAAKFVPISLAGTKYTIQVDGSNNPIAILNSTGQEVPRDGSGEVHTLSAGGLDPGDIIAFIWEYGSRAVDFLECIGEDLPLSCWLDIAACIIVPDPFACIVSIVCGVEAIVSCAKK